MNKEGIEFLTNEKINERELLEVGCYDLEYLVEWVFAFTECFKLKFCYKSNEFIILYHNMKLISKIIVNKNEGLLNITNVDEGIRKLCKFILY